MTDFPGRQEKIVFSFSDRKVLVKMNIFNPIKTYRNEKKKNERKTGCFLGTAWLVTYFQNIMKVAPFTYELNIEKKNHHKRGNRATV